MRLFAASLSAALLATASAASAQPAAPPTADASCLLAMVALSNSSNPDAQHAGQEGVVFFVGRISAHDPGFDFGRLKAMAATMTPQTAQADLQQRCGPLLDGYMHKLDGALGAPSSPQAPAAPPVGH